MFLITLIAAAIPIVASLLEQISIAPRTWQEAIHLANAMFSISLIREHWQQFAFTCQEQYFFIILSQVRDNSDSLS